MSTDDTTPIDETAKTTPSPTPTPVANPAAPRVSAAPPASAEVPTPTPAASIPSAPIARRRRALAGVGIAVGGVLLLAGAFGGGFAVATAVDAPGSGQVSDRFPGGRLPQGPGQDREQGGPGTGSGSGSDTDSESDGDTSGAS